MQRFQKAAEEWSFEGDSNSETVMYVEYLWEKRPISRHVSRGNDTMYYDI